MFDGVGNVIGQHVGPSINSGNGKEIFATEDVGIESVVQPHVRVAPASFNPLGMPHDFSQAAEIRPNLRMVREDMTLMPRIEVEIVPEHILNDLHHNVLISQGLETYKPCPTGTGLSLAVVQGIMQEHGGRIEVVSQPGQGTTVRLSLPIAI